MRIGLKNRSKKKCNLFLFFFNTDIIIDTKELIFTREKIISIHNFILISIEDKFFLAIQIPDLFETMGNKIVFPFIERHRPASDRNFSIYIYTRLSLSNVRTRSASSRAYTYTWPRIIGVTTISVIIDGAPRAASIQPLVYTVNDREFHRINFQFSARELICLREQIEKKKEKKGREIGGEKRKK